MINITPNSYKNNRKKVAFILTPLSFAGMERVCILLLKYADNIMFDIDPVVIIRPWEINNIFISELENIGKKYYKIQIATNKKFDPLRLFRCKKQIYDLCKIMQYDILHTNGYFADIIGFTVAKKLHIPIISTCHGFTAPRFLSKLWVYKRLDQFLLRYFNAVIAVSKSTKYELINRGVDEHRVHVIPNAINTDFGKHVNPRFRNIKRREMGISDNDLVIGYIGRLSEEKGLMYLLHTIRYFEKDGLYPTVLLIGDGPQKKQLKKYVKEQKIENQVIFAGFQHDIENWFPTIDIFTLPSITEGTPMVLLEAMAYGVPVVATRVGGIPDFIDHGKNGLLVAPRNSIEIKNAISAIINNETLRYHLCMEAKKTIMDRFDLSHWIKDISNIYLNKL